MMNRFLFIAFFILISFSLNTKNNDVVKILKSNLKQNILNLSSNNTDKLKNNLLLASFKYDKNKILYKSDSFNKTFNNFPLKIIHSNFINLLHIENNMIYLSDLFSYKNKLLYFIGKKNNEGWSLFLYNTIISSSDDVAEISDENNIIYKKNHKNTQKNKKEKFKLLNTLEKLYYISYIEKNE